VDEWVFGNLTGLAEISSKGGQVRFGKHLKASFSLLVK